MMPSNQEFRNRHTSGDEPTAADEHFVGGSCYGSSSDGGECEAMDISFDSIDSWSEDGDADDGAEQTKLVTDGGERLRDDVEHAPDRPYGTAQARKVNRNALRASLHERGFIGVDLTMHNRDYALVDLSGVPEPRQEVAEVYFESWEAAFRERDVQGFGWGVRI